MLGDLLAKLDLSDPSKVAKVEPYQGAFDDILDIVEEDERQLINVLLLLDGFERGDPTTLAKDLTDDNVNVVVDEAAQLLQRYLVVESRCTGRADGRRGPRTRRRTQGRPDEGHRRRSSPFPTQAAHYLMSADFEGVIADLRESAASGVDPAPMTLVSALAQLAALPGDAYGDLALLALRVSLVANDEAPTPRTLDTRLFDKASLTRGYALIELETGSAAATAFLGNLSVETPSKLTAGEQAENRPWSSSSSRRRRTRSWGRQDCAGRAGECLGGIGAS